jgi:hypothetical protein
VNSRSTFEKEEEERNQDPETRSMFQWDWGGLIIW